MKCPSCVKTVTVGKKKHSIFGEKKCLENYFWQVEFSANSEGKCVQYFGISCLHRIHSQVGSGTINYMVFCMFEHNLMNAPVCQKKKNSFKFYMLSKTMWKYHTAPACVFASFLVLPCHMQLQSLLLQVMPQN